MEREKLAEAILRVVIGIIFLAHGYLKLNVMGIENVAGFLANLGFPFSLFFAWVLTLTEILGGIALIINVFTKQAVVLLSIIMIIAIWKVKLSIGLIAPPGKGVGAELDLALLAGLLAIYLLSDKPCILDRYLTFLSPKKPQPQNTKALK